MEDNFIQPLAAVEKPSARSTGMSVNGSSQIHVTLDISTPAPSPTQKSETSKSDLRQYQHPGLTYPTFGGPTAAELHGSKTTEEKKGNDDVNGKMENVLTIAVKLDDDDELVGWLCGSAEGAAAVADR